MVQHLIIWDFKDSMTAEEKTAQAAIIKERLEGLLGQIPGLLSLHIYSNLLSSSNGDLVLVSSFDSAEALAVYTDHPAHVKVAVEAVRPFTQNRRCADFEC